MLLYIKQFLYLSFLILIFVYNGFCEQKKIVDLR